MKRDDLQQCSNNLRVLAVDADCIPLLDEGTEVLFGRRMHRLLLAHRGCRRESV